MTAITEGELKIILFSLFFMSISGLFLYVYNSDTSGQITTPITSDSTANAKTDNTGSSSWIAGILQPLPSPFNDPYTTLIFACFLGPISALMLPIAVRYIKDLATQWV